MPTPTGPYSGHGGAVRALAVTPDGDQIVTGGEDGTARVWQRLTGDLVGTLVGHVGPVHAVVVTPDGDQIVTGGEDGTARVWQRLTGDLVTTLTRHSGPVHAVGLTPDGGQIVTGEDGKARVWDRHTGDLVSTLIGHTVLVRAVVVTPEGAQIITAAAGDLRVWDLTGALLRTLVRGTDPIQAMTITPDGAQILTGGQDGAIRVWDRDTGGLVMRLSGHPAPVHAVAITPDGGQIVTGCQNGEARVWDRDTGAPVMTLSGHPGPVHAVAITPDGAQILTGGGHGDIRIWDRTSGVPIAGTSLGAIPKSTFLAEVTSDAESPDDLLGIRSDVRTVAALAAAVSTVPPLSIALLGDWGAGKSTFMRQMCDRIQHLAELSRTNPGRSLFAANVRQIRFNAWHYSDDTVWVGLVEHLFQTLADSDPARPKSPEEVSRERVALATHLAGNKARRARIARPGSSTNEPRPTPSTLSVIAGIAARDVLGRLRRHVLRTLTALGIVAAAAVAVVLWRHELIAAVVAITAAATAAVATWSFAPKIFTAVRAQVRAETARRTAQLDQDIRSDEAKLRQLDAARRLGDYLIELRKPDRYADYRGLLGRVYNDLRDLADSLTAARRQWSEGGSMGPPPLQRIVLYIDDLDRCPPPKVVDVLRAAHLLLALPLFVVIFAVDPRWLQRAIEQQPAMPFRPQEDGRASPTDYLDKIFQVPFALRPIGARAGRYIESLLPDATSTAPRESASGGSSARRPRPAPAQRAGGEHERAAPLGNPAARHGGATTSARVPHALPEFDDLRPDGLRITAVERAFLARLGPLLSTPRAVKRLVNLYRILRIGIADDMIDDFVGTAARGGPYQAAALLLAVIVGSADEGRQLLLALRTVRPDKEITEFLRGNSQNRLADLIESIDRDIAVHREAGTFRAWGCTVARFSFATYDLFLDVDDM